MLTLLLGLASSAWAAGESNPVKPEIDPETLMALAPSVVQVVNLAVLHPDLAAALVPESWIDFVLSSAIDVEAEVSEPAPNKRTPAPRPDPRAWPIGPWASPATLAHTIKALDPAAVAALYRSLRPRMTNRCERLGAGENQCGRAIRTTVSRLSSPDVLTRATGVPEARPLTATQIELSRLGEPVVVAVRNHLQALGTALWGASRPKPRPLAR